MNQRYPNRLRELRGLSFTQEELAARLNVEPSTYRSWEAGTLRPRPYNVRALLALFGVDELALGYRLEPSS